LNDKLRMGLEVVGDEHGADLANLVGFRAATLFGLEIDQDREPRAGEDMIPAGRPLFPAGALEEKDDVAEAMVVVFGRIEERGADFGPVGHGGSKDGSHTQPTNMRKSLRTPLLVRRGDS